jgi:hypothetical protein
MSTGLEVEIPCSQARERRNKTLRSKNKDKNDYSSSGARRAKSRRNVLTWTRVNVVTKNGSFSIDDPWSASGIQKQEVRRENPLSLEGRGSG